MSSLGSFVYADERYPLPRPDDLTLGEGAEVERMSGEGLNRTFVAFVEGSALATRALFALAVRKAGKEITDERLDQLRIGALDFEWDEEITKEAEADPLESDAKPAAKKSRAATPAASGTPSLETSST